MATATRPDFQWRDTWALAWRWLLSGVAGIILNMPLASAILGFLLFSQLFRAEFMKDSWSFIKKLSLLEIWSIRLGIVFLASLGLIKDWNNASLFPFLMAWVGFLLAALIRTFTLELRNERTR